MDLRILASQIATIHNKFLSETNLKHNRTFYLCYSYLFEFIRESTFPDPTRQIPPDEFQNPNNQDYAIRQMPSDEFNWHKNIESRIRQLDLQQFVESRLKVMNMG